MKYLYNISYIWRMQADEASCIEKLHHWRSCQISNRGLVINNHKSLIQEAWRGSGPSEIWGFRKENREKNKQLLKYGFCKKSHRKNFSTKRGSTIQSCIFQSDFLQNPYYNLLGFEILTIKITQPINFLSTNPFLRWKNVMKNSWNHTGQTNALRLGLKIHALWARSRSIGSIESI